MYVIISHDVDHLFGRDHWFRDLIYPKLWVRSTLQLVKRQISIREWWLRCSSCFRHKRNNIEEIMRFDKENGVPSTFFFGMNQGLGLSYRPAEAKEIILKTRRAGFDVGVHGIIYDSKEGIEQEYKKFIETVGFEPCGIRMHYVRFNEKTFEYESLTGYQFDTTEFDKSNNGTRKDPYQVGDMWEFPLSIMDGYLPNQLSDMKADTLKLLQECEAKKMEYVTILFHDCYFSEEYQALYKWYMWLIGELKSTYSFVSFRDAITQLSCRKKSKNDMK